MILRVFVKDWIDEWGGWWLYRWGDAAIRGVQAWLMLEALFIANVSVAVAFVPVTRTAGDQYYFFQHGCLSAIGTRYQRHRQYEYSKDSSICAIAWGAGSSVRSRKGIRSLQGPVCAH